MRFVKQNIASSRRGVNHRGWPGRDVLILENCSLPLALVLANVSASHVHGIINVSRLRTGPASLLPFTRTLFMQAFVVQHYIWLSLW